jgi:hypothetical protein
LAVDWVLRADEWEAADPLEETISVLADPFQREEADAGDAVLADVSLAGRRLPLTVGRARAGIRDLGENVSRLVDNGLWNR